MDENMNTEITEESEDIEDIETDVEDVEEEPDTDEDGDEEIDAEPERYSDGDFEYDENGDIIIPDDGEESDDSTDEITPAKEESEKPESDESDTETEVAEPTQEPVTDKDRELAALRQKYAALEAQSKDTLAKLGVSGGNVMDGLVKLAAEAEEITPEEYLRRKNEQDRTTQAVKLIQTMQFEQKMKADLAEVHAAFPETRQYDSVTKFPNLKKFGEFRDLGLSPKEAYIAANPDTVRQSVATATKRQSLNETKNHLKPVVSKESKDNSITITKKELLEYRDMFPGMSDKEIIRLYRQAKKK